MWRNPAPEDAHHYARGNVIDLRGPPFMFGLREGLRDRYSSLPLAPAPGTSNPFEQPLPLPSSLRPLPPPRPFSVPPLTLPPLPTTEPPPMNEPSTGYLPHPSPPPRSQWPEQPDTHFNYVDSDGNAHRWPRTALAPLSPNSLMPELTENPEHMQRFEDAQAPPEVGSEREGEVTEYEAYTQEDTMSEASESRSMHRLPLADFNARPEDLEAAKRELLETGLDVDAVDAMADRIRQLGAGLMAELDRITFALGSVKESSLLYQQALKPIQQALEKRDLLSEAHADGLLKSEEGLLDAIEVIQSESADATHAHDVINAKLVLLQQLGRAMGDTSGIPLCSICYVKPIAVAAKPCGHTYCAGCSGKMLAKRRKTCYICSQNCSGSMPLHFP